MRVFDDDMQIAKIYPLVRAIHDPKNKVKRKWSPKKPNMK